jgi:hypothetical protein
VTSSPAQRCPTCGGLDYRRSHAKGLLDYIMAAAHRKPMRCRHCGRRFYQVVPRQRPEDDEEETEKHETA